MSHERIESEHATSPLTRKRCEPSLNLEKRNAVTANGNNNNSRKSNTVTTTNTERNSEFGFSAPSHHPMSHLKNRRGASWAIIRKILPFKSIRCVNLLGNTKKNDFFWCFIWAFIVVVSQRKTHGKYYMCWKTQKVLFFCVEKHRLIFLVLKNTE